MSIIAHYTKLGILLNHILEDQSFLMNWLSRMNDPFEYTTRTPFAIARDHDEQFSLALRTYENVLEHKIRVGCFVADSGKRADYKTWDSVVNLPLWAHYGEKNQGVAIVLDKDLFLEACRKKVENSWALYTDKIKYSPSLMSLEHPSTIRLDEIDGTGEEEIAKYIFDKAKIFWFHKSHEWHYENEYRVMLFSDEIGPLKVDITSSLMAVVFGDRVSYFVKDTIGDYCDKNGLQALAVNFDEISNSYFIKEFDV